MKLKKFFVVSTIIIISIVFNSCSRNTITHFPEYFKEVRKNALHKNTEWNVRSSVKFDALCFINTLTGDPFYLSYHSKEYSAFEAGMDDGVKKSLNRLKQFKDKHQFQLANLLVSYAFVMEQDQTPEDLIHTFENPEQMYKST